MIPVPAHELPLPLTDLNQVLTTTRAVRWRLDYERPVDLAIIGECLQLAMQAPTGGDAQDWRWIVIGDAEIKAKVAGYYLDAFREHVHKPLTGDSAAAGRDIDGRLGGVREDGQVTKRTDRMLRGAYDLASNIGRAPYLVLPCATRPNPAEGGAGQVSAVYGSIYPAIWQFNLALRARGLGTCLTTLHLYHALEIAALLGIPRGTMQITLLPVAYTLGTAFKPAARKPVHDIAFLNAWGTPLPYLDRLITQLGGAVE